jgi:hypothetical protein
MFRSAETGVTKRKVEPIMKTITLTLAATLMTAGLFAAPVDDPAVKKTTTVHKRKENQQDRIAQGVKSGQLTPKETARLETKEAKINHEVRQERKANGGNLTNTEKKQINHQQNKVSKEVYKEKHDAQKQ